MNAHASLSNMREAALEYAAHGWPVFPCIPTNKKPWTEHGFKDATTDARTITSWWTRWPLAMVGVPTGRASGLLVLDVDVDKEKGVNGLVGLDALIREHGKLPGTLEARTPRGGWHIYFTWAEGLTNSRGNLPPGIDVRGEGGYVVVPPSWRQPDHKQYQWDDTTRLFQPAKAPEWLLKVIGEKPAQPAAIAAPVKQTGASSRYGERALAEDCGRVETAARGTRNEALNRAAFSVAQLVAGGELDEGLVHDRLVGAATACGLVADDGIRTVERTIASGFKGGVTQPRSAPERTLTDGRGAHPESGQFGQPVQIDGPQAAQKPANGSLVRGIRAADLKAMEFPPIRYVVPGYIAEGLTIFAGKPKIGKSWLCLDIGCAVAFGGVAFGGDECEQGDVLYAALEDNLRRLQGRLRRVLPFQPWPSRFTLWTDCPRLDNGGVDAIRQWIEAADAPRLVIIDTLAKVRGSRSDKDTAYEGDYRAMEALHVLASEKGVAIVLVHHVRKMDAEDPLDTVSGTLGLTGAADTVLVMRREAHGVTLYGRGRNVPEIERAMKFDPERCLWTVLGDVEEVRRSDERNAILDALREAEAPMAPSELANVTGQPNGNIRKTLFVMAKAGQVEKVGRGRYCLPITSETSIASTEYSCQSNHLGSVENVTGNVTEVGGAVTSAYARAREGEP